MADYSLVFLQTTEDTGRRPYRPNDQYVTSGSCRPIVNEYGPTLLTDREVLTDYICQRSIDLALLLLTLLQGSSNEAVNPIKLCFCAFANIVARQYTTKGLLSLANTDGLGYLGMKELEQKMRGRNRHVSMSLTRVVKDPGYLTQNDTSSVKFANILTVWQHMYIIQTCSIKKMF